MKVVVDFIMSLRGMWTANNAAAFKRHLTTFLASMVVILGAITTFMWTTGKPWAEDLIRKAARTESMVSITDFNVLKDSVANTAKLVDTLNKSSDATNQSIMSLTTATTKQTNESAKLEQSVTDLVNGQRQLADLQKQLAELLKQQQEKASQMDLELTRHATQLDDIRDATLESQRDIKTLLSRPQLPPILAPGANLQGH